MDLCRGCGTELDNIWSGSGLHPLCNDPIADQVAEEIRALIRWGSDTSARSRQVSPGPSELGVSCERRLAYRLAGVSPVNDRDPLISVVGTGLHEWLAKTITRFNDEFGEDFLLSEQRLRIDDKTFGVSDAYHPQLKAVIDFKSAGADVLKKLPDYGPDPAYRTQVHLYGLGYERAGLPVEQVMLVYIPRSGMLSSIQVWREAYDRDVALEALGRRNRIQTMIDDVTADGVGQVDFNAFTATGSAKECFFCPYHGKDMLMGATERFGCPGADK